MNKVFACIDGRPATGAVIDWAVWSAARLDTPLEFLHVLERHPERAPMSDYSGAIGLGAQDALLQALSELDAQRGRLAQEAGRQLLVGARERAAAAAATRVDGRLRHGDLAEAVLELEPESRLFVLGAHSRAGRPAALHLDHHVEQVVRTVRRPVLVAKGQAFSAPRRFAIAFDGSATARKAVEMVANSPLLAGLPVVLAMAGEDTALARGQLDAARQSLLRAGHEVAVEVAAGHPEEVLPALVRSCGADLLAMGAYGHSRIRQLVVGSTTTTLLRLSEVPVLILR